MFRGLYIDSARNVGFKEEQEPPLGDRQVRIRTEFASIKHGTDFHIFSGESPFEDEYLDSSLRLFRPKAKTAGALPMATGFVGNTAIGVITEVGRDVTGYQPGDRVYCYAPACEVLTKEAADIHALTPPMTTTDAVCLDPALYGYAAVRDARACLGDNIVVFGLGAIGLLIVQMLRLGGCLNLIAVDPIARRRELAQRFGAGLVLDPTIADVALEIRRVLGQGADIAIEASGNYHALCEAIRSVQPCARVVTLGYYKGQGHALAMGKEWMHNRLELIGSMPTWGNPPRDYPLWTEQRLVRTVETLFQKKWLVSEGIVDPIVNFQEAARAFLDIYHDPGSAIKLGIRFPGT